MLDSNGSNTTAAAGVALLAKAKDLKGKKAVVLAGTGPVGMRAAGFFGMEGCDVTITSRTKERAEQATKVIEKRFGIKVSEIGLGSLDKAIAKVDGKEVSREIAADRKVYQCELPAEAHERSARVGLGVERP